VAPIRPRPPWRSLTAALDLTAGPPRRILAAAFPFLRDVQTDYRDAVGPIRVPGGRANPGTIGTAFDVWAQLQAWRRPALELAAAGAELAGPALAAANAQLMDRLGAHEETWNRPVDGPWAGPCPGLEQSDLLRLCWASACLIEVFRTGVVVPGSPLTLLPQDRPGDLLSLAPPAAVDELSDLADLARDRLLPRLHALTLSGPTWLGPTFAGSTLMPADADLVVGHTLIELKTVQGRKTPAGRRAALDGITLFQLLGYVLHDTDDAHQITSVALYQARYGHLAVWNLDRLLHRLAGREVDLAALRRQWAAMLAAGPNLERTSTAPSAPGRSRPSRAAR